MKLFRIISLILMASQLWACAASHNLKPEYHESSHELMIDSLKINSITYYNEKVKNVGELYGAKVKLMYFKADDLNCPNLSITQVKADANTYFHYSAMDEIMIAHNDSCLTRKIENINSIRCMNKVGGEIGLFLTSSTQSHMGHGSKYTYQLPSNDCLKKLETFFINKTEPRKVGEYKSNKLGSPEEGFLKSLVE